jgi:hypothetical protein
VPRRHGRIGRMLQRQMYSDEVRMRRIRNSAFLKQEPERDKGQYPECNRKAQFFLPLELQRTLPRFRKWLPSRLNECMGFGPPFFASGSIDEGLHASVDLGDEVRHGRTLSSLPNLGSTLLPRHRAFAAL